MDEQRASSRIDARHFISFDILNNEKDIILSGMALSLNLSRKGVQIEYQQSFPQNAEVDLHLAVGEEIIDIKGNVRHMEKISENTYHIGIEFQTIEENKLKRIAEYYPDILK